MSKILKFIFNIIAPHYLLNSVLIWEENEIFMLTLRNILLPYIDGIDKSKSNWGDHIKGYLFNNLVIITWARAADVEIKGQEEVRELFRVQNWTIRKWNRQD